MDGSGLPPFRRAGLLDKIAFWITGVDEETLRLCPQSDLDNVRAVAQIMIFVWIYQTALFSIITHRLFAEPGHVRPELILISIFLATFIMLIDSYMVMRSGWHLAGIEELKRGGIDISGGVGARVKAGIFLTIRILLSVCIAQLTAIFIGILVFWSDIAPRIQVAYVQNNASVIAAAMGQVDAQIGEAKEALAAESARAAALAAQVAALRQDQIDPSANRPEIQQANQEIAQLLSEKAKADDALRNAQKFASDELGGIRGSQENSGIAGDGPKRRAAMEALENAKNTVTQVSTALDAARARIDALRNQSASSSETTKRQAQDELPRFELALRAEEGKVEALRHDVDRRVQHREEAIQAAIKAAPNHIDAENGLLSQIGALEQMAQADTKVAAVIVLIDLTSFGFELAAVLAKVTSFVPTTYTALLARDVYMRVVRLVDGMMTELNRKPSEAAPPVDPVDRAPPRDEPAHDTGSADGPDSFGNGGDPFASPMKRPRGRPPKASFNGKPDSPFAFGDRFPPDNA